MKKYGMNKKLLIIIIFSIFVAIFGYLVIESLTSTPISFNETGNVTNQTIISIPLEKPPFIK